MRLVLATSASVLALMTLAPTTAYAQWALSWTRGSGADACIDESSLRSAVVEQLGADPFGEPAARLIDGRVHRRDEDGFRFEMRVVDERGNELGHRLLDVPSVDCASVDAAGVVLIAAVIAELDEREPDATLPEPTPPATSTPAPVTTPPEPEDPLETGENDDRLVVDVYAGGTVAAGILPNASVAVAVGATFWPARFVPISLESAFWSHTGGDVQGGRIRLSLFEGSLGLCPDLVGDVVTLSLCGQLIVGWLHAEGHGFTTDLASDQLYLAGQALARLDVSVVGRFFIGVDVGARVPFIRDTFYVMPAPGERFDAHEMAPISPVAALRFGARF